MTAITQFLTGYYSDEMADQTFILKENLANSRPEIRARLRDELAELIRLRSMSTMEFLKATSKWFPDEDEMYRQLAKAYEDLFDEE